MVRPAIIKVKKSCRVWGLLTLKRPFPEGIRLMEEAYCKSYNLRIEEIENVLIVRSGTDPK